MIRRVLRSLFVSLYRGILSWYRMMGNTDFLFDGPQSRENESHLDESEQLVRGAPEEFHKSTVLQYFVGRSRYLKVRMPSYVRPRRVQQQQQPCTVFALAVVDSHTFSVIVAVLCRRPRNGYRSRILVRPILLCVMYLRARRRAHATTVGLTRGSTRLQGDLDGSIQAYEAGSTIVDCCFVNMRAMYLHELGFMHAVRLDWTTACKRFACVAGDNTWMRPYHYFMATRKDCDISRNVLATVGRLSRSHYHR